MGKKKGHFCAASELIDYIAHFSNSGGWKLKNRIEMENLNKCLIIVNIINKAFQKNPTYC